MRSRFAETRRRSCLLLRYGIASLLALCGIAFAAPSLATQTTWVAVAEETGSGGIAKGAPGRFSIAFGDSTAEIGLEYGGRSFEARVPIAALPSAPPLGAKAGLMDSHGLHAKLASGKLLPGGGWNIWDGRPLDVLSAGPGKVLAARADSAYGPAIEIDHGSGLRTRYLLGRFGSSAALVGAEVAAGEKIGELGIGLPDAIPYLHFGILLDIGRGELVVLDPAPFMFRSAASAKSVMAVGILNSAIRANDEEEVKKLLSLGLDPDSRAADGTLPLEWVVIFQNVALARALIDAGADPGSRTALDLCPAIANSGPSILELAIEGGNTELVSALSRR